MGPFAPMGPVAVASVVARAGGAGGGRIAGVVVFMVGVNF